MNKWIVTCLVLATLTQGAILEGGLYWRMYSFETAFLAALLVPLAFGAIAFAVGRASEDAQAAGWLLIGLIAGLFAGIASFGIPESKGHGIATFLAVIVTLVVTGSTSWSIMPDDPDQASWQMFFRYWFAVLPLALPAYLWLIPKLGWWGLGAAVGIVVVQSIVALLPAKNRWEGETKPVGSA